MRLEGLAPLADARARVLILGSFPSAASLDAGQYYAFRYNQFWRIMSQILGQPLVDMDYADRRKSVLAAEIAIWDVLASCERVGSLDADICNGRLNDFASLSRLAPKLSRVCFNGGKAFEYAPVLRKLGHETVKLPSTSPANASWSFERKLAAWRVGLCLDAK